MLLFAKGTFKSSNLFTDIATAKNLVELISSSLQWLPRAILNNSIVAIDTSFGKRILIMKVKNQGYYKNHFAIFRF